jgi:hypothetical protein
MLEPNQHATLLGRAHHDSRQPNRIPYSNGEFLVILQVETAFLNWQASLLLIARALRAKPFFAMIDF